MTCTCPVATVSIIPRKEITSELAERLVCKRCLPLNRPPPSLTRSSFQDKWWGRESGVMLNTMVPHG